MSDCLATRGGRHMGNHPMARVHPDPVFGTARAVRIEMHTASKFILRLSPTSWILGLTSDKAGTSQRPTRHALH
jgi:hypothetical protein